MAALVIAIGILALAYMASYVFNMPQWRAIIQDEGLQVLATGAVLLCILGVNQGIDSYMVSILRSANDTTSTSMMAAAQNVLGPSGLEGKAVQMYQRFADADTELGKEASRSVFCSFLGVGFSLVNCSPLGAFMGSLTTAAFATTTALADTYAQQFILSLAATYSFTFMIPFGLFLRCFKFSRQAGGALIAIGFGFYTVFPTVIVAVEKTLHGQTGPPAVPGVDRIGECDPAETDVDVSREQFRQYSNKITDPALVENAVYIVLVEVLFCSILNLIITLGFIRMFGQMIGSDIDVSSLARIS